MFVKFLTKFFHKRALVKALSNPKFKFRKIGTLQAAIGDACRDYTVALLGEIGARPSKNNNDLWALTALVGANASTPLPREPKDALRALLESRSYKFRNIETLCRRVGEPAGLDQDEVEELLVEIGARQSRRDDDLWGLKSRVGEGYARSY
jgi:hypothetical protein